MQLKISSITNLTDARFFSAFGAHYLGFCFDVLNENNINIAKAKEIISWLHEPVIVGEFGIHQAKEEIEFIAQQLDINEIQIPVEHRQKDEFLFDKFIETNNLPMIDSQRSTDYFVWKLKENDIAEMLRQVQHDGVNELSTLPAFIKNNKVFIEFDFTKDNILPIIEKLQPYGIQITCRKEEKTGLSAVDEYAEILELVGFL